MLEGSDNIRRLRLNLLCILRQRCACLSSFQARLLCLYPRLVPFLFLRLAGLWRLLFLPPLLGLLLLQCLVRSGEERFELQSALVLLGVV